MADYSHQSAANAWFINGIIGALGTLFVLIVAVYRKEVIRHPQNLDCFRCLVDFIFSVNLIVWFAAGSPQDADGCEPYAIVMQFTFTASFLWFFITCKDLSRTIRDPFSFYSGVNTRYHILVWGLSTLSVLLLNFPIGGAPSFQDNDKSNDDPVDMYGEDLWGMCWVRETKSINWYKQLLLILPMICILIYAIIVLRRSFTAFSTGLDTSRNIRTRVLIRYQTQVVSFTILWCCAGVSYFASFMYSRTNGSEESGDEDHKNNTIIAVIATLLGTFRCGVIDPVLFLRSIGIHFRRSGRMMPLNEIFMSIWQEGRALTDDEMNESRQAAWGDLSTFDLLTAETREQILTEHLRTDVIAATSLGIGASAKMAAEAWEKKGGVSVEELIRQGNECGDMAQCSNKVLEHIDDGDYCSDAVVMNLGDIADAEESIEGKFNHASFHDFCPIAFHAIRTSAGLSLEDYMLSIQGHDEDRGKLTSMVEKFTEGRSGSFFYWTHDRRYMVKTVTSQERRVICEMLKEYCEHNANYPDTLINKIYGCHGIQMHPGESPKYFLVMESVMWTGNKPITHMFDLKGSTVDRTSYKKAEGRERLDAENAAGKVENQMKDSDLDHINFRVWCTPENRARLLEQIRVDTELFEKHNIMDYSMLLAKHTRSATDKSEHDKDKFAVKGYQPKHRLTEGGLMKVHQAGDKPGEVNIYYVGIIDILQLYDYKKEGELFLKGTCLMKGRGISSVPASEYRARYLAKMNEIFVCEGDEVDVEANVGVESAPAMEMMQQHEKANSTTDVAAADAKMNPDSAANSGQGVGACPGLVPGAR